MSDAAMDTGIGIGRGKAGRRSGWRVDLLVVALELAVDVVERLLRGPSEVQQVVAAEAVRVLVVAVFVPVAAGERDVVPDALAAVVGPHLGFDASTNADGVRCFLLIRYLRASGSTP